jgi:hypothetical protein
VLIVKRPLGDTVRDNHLVSIDADFARFGNKSYAISKINSVEVRKVHPTDLAATVVFSFLALVAFCGVILNSLFGLFLPLIMTLIFSGAAYWSWSQYKKVQYRLYVTTSSREAQAYVSRDEDEVLNLRDQIEACMSRQRPI